MNGAGKAIRWAVMASLMALTTPSYAEIPVEKAINQIRSAEGRAPLSYSRALETIAQRHAEDIANRRKLSHKGANGSGPGDRALAAGYQWCRIAENVAWGQGDLRTVMRDWHRSAGHRRNMLNANVAEFGIARAEGDFWVMVLAAPGCGT